MNAEHLLDFSKHFVKYTRCSTDSHVLLLSKTHDSHLSIAALDYLKNNGVAVLSFCPTALTSSNRLIAGYATNRPQPSDIIASDDDQHDGNPWSSSQEKDDHAIAGPSTSTPQITTASGNLQAPAATK
ncbi:hypothetical protein JTB14_002405 [Gonioctena quinquepunctata]|nr:hypothetical protein JTB14_002405 [Gonioctena quinquepunctata]